MTPLQSLVATGTKLWLDSVDPVEIATNRANGATGATSNPIIISDLLMTGRFDADIVKFIKAGHNDETIAWEMTDKLVKEAQLVFAPVSKETGGNDGWVSFELDPLIEDNALNLPVAERTKRYIELGKKWSAGHKNRMIKVPGHAGRARARWRSSSAAGREPERHAHLQRAAVPPGEAIAATWRGIQRACRTRTPIKTVYSIFVSRVDVYTEKALPPTSRRRPRGRWAS